MELFKVVLTSVLSAFALFVIAKVIGHKQMSQLDFFDYITGITIGSIAAVSVGLSTLTLSATNCSPYLALTLNSPSSSSTSPMPTIGNFPETVSCFLPTKRSRTVYPVSLFL